MRQNKDEINERIILISTKICILEKGLGKYI